jgi:hypothetical protein
MPLPGSPPLTVTANTWHCRAGFAAQHATVPVINLGTLATATAIEY